MRHRPSPLREPPEHPVLQRREIRLISHLSWAAGQRPAALLSPTVDSQADALASYRPAARFQRAAAPYGGEPIGMPGGGSVA